MQIFKNRSRTWKCVLVLVLIIQRKKDKSRQRQEKTHAVHRTSSGRTHFWVRLTELTLFGFEEAVSTSPADHCQSKRMLLMKATNTSSMMMSECRLSKMTAVQTDCCKTTARCLVLFGTTRAIMATTVIPNWMTSPQNARRFLTQTQHSSQQRDDCVNGS